MKFSVCVWVHALLFFGVLYLYNLIIGSSLLIKAIFLIKKKEEEEERNPKLERAFNKLPIILLQSQTKTTRIICATRLRPLTPARRAHSGFHTDDPNLSITFEKRPNEPMKNQLNRILTSNFSFRLHNLISQECHHQENRRLHG